MRLGLGVRPVGRTLLHFNADEPGLEDYLLRVDLRDVELRRRTLAVEELEHLERCAVALHVADVGVDVREREVRLLLRERVERDALGEDLADDLVVALDLGLLVGVHRVAEEDPRPALPVLVELDAGGVRELRSAVGEDHGEEPREELRAEFRVKAVEHRRDAFRALVGDEDPDHEPRVEPVERQEADAPRTPDDEVHVDGADVGMLREELPVVLVGAPDVAARLDLVLVFLRERLPRPHRAGALEVAALRGEDAVVDVALDGALVAGELRRVGDADVVDGLPVPDLRGDEFVEVVQLALVQRRALAVFAQDPAVVAVRAAGVVDELALVAALHAGAAVADLRGPGEPVGAVDVLDLAAEPVAVAVAAHRAARALGRAVPADLREPAVLPVDALVGAPVAALEGLVGVLGDLARDRRQADADLLRDCPCGLSGLEAELDAAPLGAVHVLLSSCHCVFLVHPAGIGRGRK